MKKLFKNIITMTLATVMAGSFMAVSATENNPENYLAGDIVSDGKINIKDATEIQRYCANLSAKVQTLEKYVTMDFNGDGVVNIQDAADIQKKTVKKIDDCNFDKALEGAQMGILFNQGQVCCAGSRILVQDTIYDKFIAALKKEFEAVKVGRPWEEGVQVGALVDERQLKKVLSYVDIGKEEAADAR